ncbi:MAG: hypothetical protein HOW73_10075 [Polyangiaceae bacterium]|nr:hypothetical protein [Polyangiaceae bacterium]
MMDRNDGARARHRQHGRLSHGAGVGAALSLSTLALGACGASDAAPVAPTSRAPAAVASTEHAAPDEATPAPAPPEPLIKQEDVAPFLSTTPELARFHAALDALEKKQRTDHVRIVWLGDSHGQADFWSGQVRKLLGTRFGKAGPGFLHLGYKNYRHDGIKLDIHGKWRMRPKKPVLPKRQGDGVYGLGGLMMSGYDDGPRVELTFTDAIPGDRARFDLCYRLVDKGDAVAYSIDGKPEVTLTEKEGQRGEIVHLSLTASTQSPFVVRPIGRADLCGVVVESDPQSHPGVVLDTLAINGARYGTALSWDEAAWTKEVARRKPDLVILEYGTNEAGDTNPSYAKVEKQVGELLGRVRSVSSNADCVVVSPTDRGDAESRVTQMRETVMKAAKAHGCYWFDAWKILGGEGSFARMSEEPEAKVQADKIHLTIKGYRELGGTMFDSLVEGLGPNKIAKGSSGPAK